MKKTSEISRVLPYTFVVAVQLLSCIQLFVTLWTAACHAPLSFTISWSFLKFMSIESVMLSNHFILWHPLLPLPSIYSIIRLFTNESALAIKWPKYWSFTFPSVLPMNIQGWFPLGLTDLISLLFKGLSRVFSSTTVQKHPFFIYSTNLFLCVSVVFYLLEIITYNRLKMFLFFFQLQY